MSSRKEHATARRVDRLGGESIACCASLQRPNEGRPAPASPSTSGSPSTTDVVSVSRAQPFFCGGRMVARGTFSAACAVLLLLVATTCTWPVVGVTWCAIGAVRAFWLLGTGAR